MSENLRHKQILEILSNFGTVSVKALTKELYVSEATIRRDLTELEKIGALKRVFGGAKPILETNKQIPLFIRESVDSIAKNEICRKASEIVKDGDSIGRYIEDIEMGYDFQSAGENYDPADIKLVPCYRVYVSGEETPYTVNAYTNEIID